MKYRAVGASIFAGGFTVGALDLFDIDTHLEHNNYGKNVKDLNLPWVETILPPWPRVDADYIYCNPPCAVWSTASHGRSTKWYDDPRLSCYEDCFNLIQNEPTILAIETVLAGWRKAPDYFIDKCVRANDLGYNATIILHDGKWLGLPQVRKRMFAVFHRVDLAWHTYKKKTPISCDHALTNPPVIYTGDDILDPDEHTQYLFLHRTYEDKTLLKIHDRLGGYRGKGSKRPVYTSANCVPGRPAPTLLHCMHMHPLEKRYLTIREMARLCGFPDWFSWDIKTGVQSKASLIARGVTPCVASWLSKLVYDSLEEDSFVTKPYIHIADILKGDLVLANAN